ncbi:hypothetical protein LB565_04205 [Mesorhizobium sp. CA14]|uniref:hypothetical protein n=1 Tax=Mesorhizobium sp. CA14 TaxID=2876642 RepID=UPI001CCDE28B|nr:hypothetical protein [Mesorhizobium sp. CA14]MBZ9847190.1 hypothetical protein [Mesorhizobium sp. CA14]
MKQILAVAALGALIATPALAVQIELTPVMVKDTTALLKAKGFNCPIVKMASAKPASARGDVVKVWCGPDDGTDNVFGDFQYRLTFRPDGGVEVAEW